MNHQPAHQTALIPIRKLPQRPVLESVDAIELTLVAFLRITVAALMAIWTVAPTHAAPSQTETDSNDALVPALIEITTKLATQRYPDAQIEATALPLPPMLAQGKTCDEYTLSVPDNWHPSRIPVRVRCQGTHPWSFFTGVKLSISIEAATTNHLLARGATIGKQDVSLKWITLTHHNQDLLHDLEAIVGQKAYRTLRPGKAMTSRDLVQPYAVSKGERVTIQARIGSAQITTTGTALSNGHIGDQISVRNETSARVIKPWISAKGTVTTRPIET
ncbi:MAG: flagellar basal body P-ring formation protein FlgA [Pseudomonadales bacterium]|nr:flagellar basal body P-ring formation protein FlgA [Pseudomonadales bacterium]